MAIYEITSDRIRRISETSFGAAGVLEREDLQRLLRSQIEIICPETLVITEEFCEWEVSRRRIDLLGLDKDANLVVIELKRTEDGGHMELQAIRYAAMVSAMTFDKAVDVFAHHLQTIGSDADARTTILEFLEWEEPDEDHFAQDVRIVLASAEFSKELTTAVMWLNDRGLDIRCVRIKPYQDDGRVLIDVQQVIPLPEAADYVVRIKEKEVRERSARRVQTERQDILRRFWAGLLQRARGKTELHAHLSPSNKHWLGTTDRVGGMHISYVASPTITPRVDLYIHGFEQEMSKKVFDQIYAHKEEIEKQYGGPLTWLRLDEKKACRIRGDLTGWAMSTDEAEWPKLQDAMIDAMIRFESALRPVLDTLDL